MSSVTHSNANITLNYQLKGSHSAKLRCKQLSIAYGVASEESHARRHRAFYPHLRVQGTFSLTFDFIGWREYKQAMSWFWDYFDAMLNTTDQPSSMLVMMDSRNFIRAGVPTTGVTFGDHVGSMVFSPTINFISVGDPRDSKASIPAAPSKSTPSYTDSAATQWFYPDSKLNKPGALQQYVYDAAQKSAADKAAAVQAAMTASAAAVDKAWAKAEANAWASKDAGVGVPPIDPGVVTVPDPGGGAWGD